MIFYICSIKQRYLRHQVGIKGELGDPARSVRICVCFFVLMLFSIKCVFGLEILDVFFFYKNYCRVKGFRFPLNW